MQECDYSRTTGTGHNMRMACQRAHVQACYRPSHPKVTRGHADLSRDLGASADGWPSFVAVKAGTFAVKAKTTVV